MCSVGAPLCHPDGHLVNQAATVGIFQNGDAKSASFILNVASTSPLQSHTPCRMCKNLQGVTFIRSVKNLPQILQQSTCTSCRILAEAIKSLYLQRGHETQAPNFADIELSVLITRNCFTFLSDYREEICGELYLLKGDLPSVTNLPVFDREVSVYPGGDYLWPILLSWLAECWSHHNLCRQSVGEDFRPKRLLRVPVCDTDAVLLIDASDIETISEKPIYCALSHCWGRTMNFVLSAVSESRLRSGLLLKELPPAFRDAFEVARRLKVEYLWIDALCIRQDDVSDWEDHAGIMGEIYRHAFFTIEAVSSKDNLDPFLGRSAPTSRPSRPPLKIEIVNIDGQSSCARVRETFKHEYNEPSGPLESRAWALQEKLLSTRIIFFSQYCVMWRCASQSQCECGKSWTPETAEHRMDDWTDILHDYSGRKLTIPTDRLPALAGCAARHQRLTGDVYLAGLWQSSLLQDLSWCHYGSGLELLPQVYIAPSWSWASLLDGKAVWFSAPHSEPAVIKAELCTVQCNPTTTSPFGHFNPDGYIELRGKVVDAVLKPNGEGMGVLSKGRLNRRWCILDCHLTEQQGPQKYNESEQRLRRSLVGDDKRAVNTKEGNVTCLLLRVEENRTEDPIVIILILSQVRSHPVRYQRIGIADTRSLHWWKPFHQDGEFADCKPWDSWRDWFGDGAEIKTVRII